MTTISTILKHMLVFQKTLDIENACNYNTYVFEKLISEYLPDIKCSHKTVYAIVLEDLETMSIFTASHSINIIDNKIIDSSYDIYKHPKRIYCDTYNEFKKKYDMLYGNDDDDEIKLKMLKKYIELNNLDESLYDKQPYVQNLLSYVRSKL